MADDDTFLSRWSRRKVLDRQGLPLPEVEPVATATVPVRTLPEPPAMAAPVPVAETAPPVPEPPPPTLDDVARLPADAADFSRFVARGVQPEVKNAALKKLFSDPHFNVMDGLDTYIDDYSQPDPLPAAMLRQMVQGRFLGLFDDDEDKHKPTDRTASEPLPHENADLRLQPDPAAGPDGVAAGPEPDAGRQR